MKTIKQRGFTLIEVIVTLVILGILTAVAGLGIVRATQSYLFTRDVSSISQKAQAAIARLNKTFVNISDVSISGGTPSAQAITVVIERDNSYITETYNFSGSSLTLTISGTTNTLLDDLDTGTSGFAYLKNDGSTWTTSSDKKDLSRIQVNLTMSSSGGNTVGFSGSFVPRNIYRPVEISDFGSGSGAAIPDVSGCFISSLSEGKHTVKSKGYILAGALLILLLALVVRRIAMKKSGQHGSVLIATIITIVVMGILGGAMVSMFSSSSVGTVTPSISNRAYYNAESAYRYVLYSFLNADENSRFQTLKDDVNGKTLVLDGGNQAEIDIEAFWFTAAGNQNNTRTLRVESPISYPSDYWSGSSIQIPSTGHINAEGQDDGNPFSYSAVSYNSGTGEFTFNLDNNITVSDGDSISLAFENSTLTSTINEGDDLSVGSGGSLECWPRKNGVISLVTNSGGTYVLTYERVNDDKTQLVNVNSAADFAALPSGGLQNYGGIKQVCLQRNARITATGHAGGSSGSFNAERRIVYYQPLIEGVIVTKHEYTDNFNNLNNWRTGGDGETGSHGIVTVNDAGVENEDGDSAMTVTATESIDGPVSGIFAAYYGKGVQESLIEYDPDVADFQDIWNKSDEKLSYEVQCKISFSGVNDNADNNPQGTFMPGIVFRARESETYSGVKEYYGLSFMRALFQQGQVSNPDADDIPDQYLFENHGTNDEIPSSVLDDICVADYQPSPRWNDTPPMSGVPYMILWQQAFDFDEWDGIWIRNSDLYVDWLAYVPLCELTQVTIYQYEAETILGEDSVPCQPCAACTPKEWTKYWWDSPIGYGWFPDCCTERTQIASGGSWLNPWRRYRCDTYDCTGDCYDATCCGSTLTYPEGWYLGPIPGDPRTPNVYTAYRVADHAEYGQILEHVNINVNGTDFDVIGSINNTVYLVRDPSTFHQPTGYRGDPIENAAFIFPDQSVSYQLAHNYRIYLKPWVTVMARIIEMKGDFYDEDGSGCGNSADERVNVIQAWFGEPGTYPRGQIRWPDKYSSSFSEMIWPDNAYTSKMDEVRAGWYTSSRRLAGRGDDEYTNTSDKRSPYVYTNQLTSAGYDGYSSDNQPAEIGLHTFGIDATGDGEEHKDRVYFDDFALRVFEYGQATGVLAGVQSE